MDGWKKAVVAASVGAATVLFLKKKYAGGVLAGGVGLARAGGGVSGEV